MPMDLSTAKKLIDAVDLSQTLERLIKVHRWPEKQALKAVRQYRRFLFLKKKYDETHVLPPSYDIDEVWHAHILHTADYDCFCKQVFGAYLHHHPRHGKDQPMTDQALEEAFENHTQRLYRLEFGEDLQPIRPLPLKLVLKRLIEFFKTNVNATRVRESIGFTDH